MTNREFLIQSGYQPTDLALFYDGANVYRIECEGIYLGLTEAPNESIALLNWLNDDAATRTDDVMQGRYEALRRTWRIYTKQTNSTSQGD